MKVWYGYGSEHSANLVMIGQFGDAGEAAKAKEIIDWLVKQVESDVHAGLMEIGTPKDHFTEGMLKTLEKVETHSLGSAEVDQFGYEFDAKVEDDKVILTTEEIDVSAFLKVLIDKGARVEVYSAHDYPDTRYGRGK